MLLYATCFAFGFVREFLVVRYLRAVIKHQAFSGSIITLLIGILDIGVFLKAAIDRNYIMAGAYIMGESLAAYFSIKLKR